MSNNDIIDIDDVEDALKRADELAELTGRTKKDIVADLLDDGQLNYSAGEDAKVKSDFLDKANEQAVKMKQLLTTLIPIMLLIAGTGAEGMGIVDVTGWGQESVWEDENPPPYQEPDAPKLWGCTDSNAINYEDWATDDDASCDYKSEPIEGCTDDAANNYDENAESDDGSCEYDSADIDPSADITNMDSSLTTEGDLKLEFSILLEGDFDNDIELVWRLWLNDEEQNELERLTLHSYDEETGYQEQYWSDLESGEWVGKVYADYNGEMLDDETFDPVTIECDDGDGDGICNEDEIEGCTDQAASNYNASATDDDGSCTYPPPPECEPVLYSAYPFYQNNNTTVTISFDIDCTNGGVSENVTVQWLAWHNGSNHSNSEGPANWTTADYTIQGQEWDEHNLSLSNFTNGSYDLCLYILWGGGVEESDFIERKWLNIIIKGEGDE
tara:strand:+ start:9870 stop:11198 length:1329 start_codon:yes stop_codon:yes gene_type:complete